MEAWLSDARTLASPNIIILLVGNKRDMEDEREVTFIEASNFAQANELVFLETSAKSGENVEEAFLKCSKTILAKIQCGELDPVSGTFFNLHQEICILKHISIYFYIFSWIWNSIRRHIVTQLTKPSTDKQDI